MVSTQAEQRGAATGAQTVHRALDILEIIAARSAGMPLAEIAAAVGLAAPTAHRLCRALVERGYVRQLPDRTYALGTRLVALGKSAHDLIGADAEPLLLDLVAELGETANLAVLSGLQAEYVAQAPSRFAMRMFTEVGRRVDLHSTGVGKALLARLDDSEARAIVDRTGMATPTPHTLESPDALMADLRQIRERGFALDEQEQEIGVRCVAVALDSASPAWMALSVSGPVTRMTDDLVGRAVPLLQAAARELAAILRGEVDRRPITAGRHPG
ncbi:IclR family transcriptional regulator [Nocardioides humi]|uniref:IclR family transcriptional regulator n=1 Tax=Nocardioides humi TaxID=449461 RepID=UPI001FE7B38B|nr:IclR family transcriptional regulator [Nocardioides humi]